MDEDLQQIAEGLQSLTQTQAHIRALVEQREATVARIRSLLAQREAVLQGWPKKELGLTEETLRLFPWFTEVELGVELSLDGKVSVISCNGKALQA